MEKSILEKNLEQIARYDEDLAQKIASVSEYTYDFGLKETTCGDLNLLINSIPIHDEVDAVYEAREIVSKTNHKKEESTIHVIFGFGIGHLFEAFSKESKGKIVVYEPNIEILRAAFEFVDFSQELAKSTVMVINEEEKFEKAMNKLFFLKGEMTLSFLNSYGKLYPDIVSGLAKKLSILRSVYTNAYSEIQKQSWNWTFLTLQNLHKVYQNKDLEPMLGSFAEKPAIIVSAGPSLLENIEYIKKYRNKVVVFSVGTALKTLLNNGVKPDFAVMIESNHCTSQIKNLDLSGIDFILYPSIFSDVYNCPIERVFNYYPDNLITSKWLEKLALVDSSKYKSRGTVSISALMSAYLLGCNPIILTGQDLAYKDGQCYASGAPYNISYKEISPGKFELFVEDYDKFFENSDKTKLKEDKESLDKSLKETSKNLCFTKGQNGKTLVTSAAYAMFVEHFEKIALEIGNNVKLFNTKGWGAQINGFENIAMEEFLQKYAKENIDVKTIISSVFSNNDCEKDLSLFFKEIDLLDSQFEVCQKLFEQGKNEYKNLKNVYMRIKLLTPQVRDSVNKISDIYSKIVGSYLSSCEVIFALMVKEYYQLNEFLKEKNDFNDKDVMLRFLDILQEFFSVGAQRMGTGHSILKKQKELLHESASSKSK